MLKNGERLGRYVVESRVGKGASARVYQGRAVTGGSARVSIKEYDFYDRDVSRRSLRKRSFEAEKRAMPLMDHANLPRFYDIIETDRKGYVIVEYVDGINLRSHVDREGRVSEPQLLFVTHDVSQALAYLHERPDPLVHADVKPDNIVVTPDGRAILIDLGLSRFLSDGLTEKVGTIGYISCETISSGDIGPYSDIYSLGWVFHFGYTGRRPLTAPAHWKRDADRQGLDRDLDGISGESIELVRSCVDSDPFKRPSAVELANKLKHRYEKLTN